MSVTIDKLKHCFVEAFAIDPAVFTAETTPVQVPNWDSLGHVRLVTAMQKEFGVEFDVAEIMQMEDVSKILDILKLRGL